MFYHSHREERKTDLPRRDGSLLASLLNLEKMNPPALDPSGLSTTQLLAKGRCRHLEHPRCWWLESGDMVAKAIIYLIYQGEVKVTDRWHSITNAHELSGIMCSRAVC